MALPLDDGVFNGPLFFNKSEKGMWILSSEINHLYKAFMDGAFKMCTLSMELINAIGDSMASGKTVTRDDLATNGVTVLTYDADGINEILMEMIYQNFAILAMSANISDQQVFGEKRYSRLEHFIKLHAAFVKFFENNADILSRIYDAIRYSDFEEAQTLVFRLRTENSNKYNELMQMKEVFENYVQV